MDIEDLPWPKKGDKLFGSNGDPRFCAFIDHYNISWNSYAIGYKRAADIIVENIQSNLIELDFLVFPIVFLYRQYIELRFKMIILDGKDILDENPVFPKTHKLDKLWNECSAILEKLWPTGERDTLEAAQEYINDFIKKDPLSTSFKYPESKDGNPSFDDTQYIDVMNLYEIMQKFDSFLSGCYDAITEEKDHKYSHGEDDSYFYNDF